jgi:hydrogenase maturation factor
VSGAASGFALACHADHCVTCGDEGTPMRVLRIDRARGLALCAAPDGARASVEIALVEPVAPGEALLVHAGVALVRLARPQDDPPQADRPQADPPERP